MRKENANYMAPYKKEESMAVAAMVEAAYIRDPRLSRHLLQQKADFLGEMLEKKNKRLKKQREREAKELAYHL